MGNNNTKKRNEKPKQSDLAAKLTNIKQEAQSKPSFNSLQFPDMVDAKQFAFKYIVGAVVMWMGLLAVTYMELRGTQYLTPMLQIMGFGACWAIVIVPVTVFRNRFSKMSSYKRPSTKQG